MIVASTIATADTAAFLAAVATCERRALHSYFDQHVIQDDEGYLAIDEGDYNNLPMHLVDRVVHSVPGAFADEY